MAKKAISGPAAAVIFLAVGVAILLSTSYISDLFGSISYERRIATKLLMERPHQAGQQIKSLSQSIYQQSADQASIETANFGGGRAVWYCNVPQPPSVSEVRASLCSATHRRAQQLVDEKLAVFNYSIRLPDCIYLNVSNPENFTLVAKGQQIVGPGINQLAPASISVTNRLWPIYNNMTQWVNEGMGDMFYELCKTTSKPCQVRECSCDPLSIESSKPLIEENLFLHEYEVKQAVDRAVEKLQEGMDEHVNCSARINAVIRNDPKNSTRATVGCNCAISIPPTCHSRPPYNYDPTKTTELNECNATTPCLQCSDTECRSILPVSGCEAQGPRLQVATIGPPYLKDMAQNLGMIDAQLEEYDPAIFDDNLLIYDRAVREYTLPSLVNFANGRIIIANPQLYQSLSSYSSGAEQSFSSKSITSNYYQIANGIVIKAEPSTWQAMPRLENRLLAAHYYDLISSKLYPKVELNCSSLIQQGLALPVIAQYPANGTEFISAVERKAYLYGTVECVDHKYEIEGDYLKFAFDFWMGIEKQCPLPPQCNGTSTNCQSALTVPLPPRVTSCHECFSFSEIPGLTVTRAEDGRIKCKYFSGSRIVCEFQYSKESALVGLPPPQRTFSVPCTCYLNNQETDCNFVVYATPSEGKSPVVRCPVAFKNLPIHNSFAGSRNCGTVKDRFGFDVSGWVCDVTCYQTQEGEVRCGDCTPNTGQACGCGACAFEMNSSSQPLYWVGNSLYFQSGELADPNPPQKEVSITAVTCSSLKTTSDCSGYLNFEKPGTFFSTLANDPSKLQYNLCMSPTQVRSGSTFLTICDCLKQTSDPELRSDAAKSDPQYLEKLSQDPGFSSCCTVCSLGRACAYTDEPQCIYEGRKCNDWLVQTGGSKNSELWPKFLSCCSSSCLSQCSACTCPGPGSTFCSQPACSLLWDSSCSPLAQNPANSPCQHFYCSEESGTPLGGGFDKYSEYTPMKCKPVEIPTTCNLGQNSCKSGVCMT